MCSQSSTVNKIESICRYCAIYMVKWFVQAVHLAAQYGQTAFLNHVVVKYHADFDVPDNGGRSPLHWYAIKLLSVMHG